jgi:hypothetical protein
MDAKPQILTFGKFEGRNIRLFSSREEINYLYWLKNSQAWQTLDSQVKKEVLNKIKPK